MDYWILLLLVGGSVILLILLFMQDISRFIESRNIILREFLKKNSGFFTLLFIFIFFLEQLLLIILAFVLEVEALAQILIGIFSLIVLTTATIEKFILEKKYSYLRKESEKLSIQNEIAFRKIRSLLKKERLN